MTLGSKGEAKKTPKKELRKKKTYKFIFSKIITFL